MNKLPTVKVICVSCKKEYYISKRYKQTRLRTHGEIKCIKCAKPVKWTLPMLQQEALKYTTRGDFQKNSIVAYCTAQQQKILDQICKHMVRAVVPTFEKLPFNTTGIYELYDKEELVYIGKSHVNIRVRLIDHKNNKQKRFNKVIVYKINNHADITVAELYLISKYKPKYNKGNISNTILTLCIENIDSIIIDTITINLGESE